MVKKALGSTAAAITLTVAGKDLVPDDGDKISKKSVLTAITNNEGHKKSSATSPSPKDLAAASASGFINKLIEELKLTTHGKVQTLDNILDQDRKDYLLSCILQTLEITEDKSINISIDERLRRGSDNITLKKYLQSLFSPNAPSEKFLASLRKIDGQKNQNQGIKNPLGSFSEIRVMLAIAMLSHILEQSPQIDHCWFNKTKSGSVWDKAQVDIFLDINCSGESQFIPISIKSSQKGLNQLMEKYPVFKNNSISTKGKTLHSAKNSEPFSFNKLFRYIHKIVKEPLSIKITKEEFDRFDKADPQTTNHSVVMSVLSKYDIFNWTRRLEELSENQRLQS